MSEISGKFAELKDRGEKGLILYVTAGDPSIEHLPQIIECLVEGGADLIEIGLPYSDPIADGPVIQSSTQRALESGVTPQKILKKLSEQNFAVPLVLMGYYNTVLRIGLEEAARGFSAAGLSGTILSDLTLEESLNWCEVSRAHHLDNIFLAAPTSTDSRLDQIVSKASGFVYAVSRTGVTGAANEVPREAKELVARLKARTELPIAVGFGVSTVEHVRMIADVADGVVIGSWLVDLLHREWKDGKGADQIAERIRSLKSATRS